MTSESHVVRLHIMVKNDTVFNRWQSSSRIFWPNTSTTVWWMQTKK